MNCVVMAQYVTSHSTSTTTYPLHDVWDLGKSLLCHLLLHGEQRGLVDMGLG